ncbi:glycosyltransferase [Micromonospora sp. URMC 105]|uniref:glycosyltransferase n=1 Tax=Micromonospora sp. URMC 105 TaxID=3423413 RepID=UPI003F1A823B
MSRYLFVVPPLTGHVNPTVAVGAELRRRGHDVAWAGRAEILRPLLGPAARLYDAGDAELDELLWASRERWLGLRGAGALKFLWEEFLIPLARASLPGVAEAVRAYRPDVLVVDQQAVAGAVLARREGLPWATCATTSGEFTRPYAAMPKVEAWVMDCMAGLQREAGLPAEDIGDLRFSEHLVLAFTSRRLLGGDRVFPDSHVFVGPALAGRSEPLDFPFETLDPARRAVLVSLGTVNAEAGRRFFATAVAAVEPCADRVQLVVVAPADVLPDPPPHVIVRPYVPQLRLLPRLDAVVCHAGHNTVCEALAHGLPLVVAPIRDDQPIIAGQVVAAGAGVRVRFTRVTPDQMGAAITAVLDEPSYRAAAARVRASFTAAGGAPVAADHLERLP